MGVLEVTLLRLKPGIQPTDQSLLRNLRDIRAQLKTNSRFYIDEQDDSNLFIFGLWPTMEAHHAFLASPKREQILGPQEGQTEFLWGLHIENVDSMEDLPLGAPIMYLHLLGTDAHLEKTLDDALNPVVKTLRRRTEDVEFALVHGPRLDPAAGKVERLVFHGMEGALGLLAEVEAICSADMRYKWQLKDLERM